ncbi:hypothetical protein [Ferruginibacter profundus]
MFKMFSLSATLLLTSLVCASQSGTLVVADDNSYRIFLPSGWVKQANNPASVEFLIIAPGQKSDLTAPTLKLETGTLRQGYENADIKAISRGELAATQQQAGNTLTVIRDSFVIINNKTWWNTILTIPISKKKSLTFFTYKTIHNRKTYALVFSAEANLFEQYLSEISGYMASIMFYTADLTTYDNTSIVTPAAIKMQLKDFEGVYTEEHPGYVNKIVIGDIGGGQYGAKEIRQLVQDGKTFTFEAVLAPQNISGKTITLNTDAVIHADLPVMWSKASYTLEKSANSLRGTFFSINNAFTPMAVALLKEGGNNVVKAAAEKPVVAKAPVNKPAKLTKTYGSLENSTEPENIKQFGGGNVTRQGDNLLLPLSNGKNITISNKGNFGDANFAEYSYLRYIDALNSHVVEEKGAESSDFVLVNKNTGATTTIMNLNYQWSPSKKAFAIFNRGSLVEQTEESSVTIFEFSEDGIKQVYREVTSNKKNNTAWAPVALKWLNDNSIEIDKEVLAGTTKTKPAGKTWIGYKALKWTLVPSAKDLPYDDGSLSGTGEPKIVLVPSATDRIYTGGKTMDELGQKLLSALKNNDKKMWYSCIMDSTYDKAIKVFDDIRNSLERDGLANWGLVKYSRTAFDNSGIIKVEFGYKDNLTGFFQTHKAILYKGKYLLENPSDYYVIAHLTRH